MKVILSIKPYYADKILDWEKKYELRRTIFKSKVTKVYIYASAPISKVIGEFEIDNILCEDIPDLWKRTKDYSCVDRKFFKSYFSNKEKWYAIKVKRPKRYKNYLSIKESFWVLPPQCFAYVE